MNRRKTILKEKFEWFENWNSENYYDSVVLFWYNLTKFSRQLFWMAPWNLGNCRCHFKSSNSSKESRNCEM
jgi:hypothetical protein